MILQEFRDGVDIKKMDKAIPVPFPLPLRNNLWYVDLDSSHLTISFWFNEADENSSDIRLCMRRFDLDSIKEPSDLNRVALLQNGSNPLLQFYAKETNSQSYDKSQHGLEFEHWEMENDQPTMMNELQYRMFTDFTYQWKFFIDDRTIWPSSSSILFQGL